VVRLREEEDFGKLGERRKSKNRGEDRRTKQVERPPGKSMPSRRRKSVFLRQSIENVFA
jgi:hypothetical protein